MPTRTLLSFLGPREYRTITYVWEGTGGAQKVTTDLFPEAAARFFQPDRVLLGVTPTVRDSENVQRLKARLSGFGLELLEIPEGRSEEELWRLFERVADAVDEGEALVLDVTHAFRSLPLMAFTVAAYLRRTKRVTVERVVYGAYEAREPLRDGEPRPEDRAPVFDLTALLDLLDWLSGAEGLLQRGEAHSLAQKLKETHDRLWRARTGRGRNVLPEELPRAIKKAAHKLEALGLALQLSRPREVMGRAAELQAALADAEKEVQRWARPFAVILGQVRAEAETLAHREPDRLDAETLRRQRELIEYALGKGLIVQAVLMAREWLVNWAALRRGEGDWLKREYRESELERALGAAARALRDPQLEGQLPEWFRRLPRHREAATQWDWLNEFRNDLAHCGFREGAAPSLSLERKAKAELLERLNALWEGEPSPPTSALYGERVVLDLGSLYEGETAKLDELPLYLERAKAQAGRGRDVVLTGAAPIWLYLAVAHALHGQARRLWYASPVTGEVLVFDHSPR